MNKIASKRIKRKLLVCFITMLFLLGFASFRFRPMIKSISGNRARMITAEIVNGAVFENIRNNPENYSKIAQQEKNSAGEITSVQADVQKINLIKSSLGALIQQKFYELKAKNLSVPMGTLTGWDILNGKGPPVPLKISASGSVITDYKSELISAGINQTLHKIYVTVHTRISVMVPGCSYITELDTVVPVAETLIVGKAPGFCGAGAMYAPMRN